MFNQGLKHRVDALCREIANLLRSQPSLNEGCLGSKPARVAPRNFSSPTIECKHVCLEGKNERSAGVWEKRDPR
jgi:hypothetical protein